MRDRILEADRAAHLDVRLFEVHPEVSFRELAFAREKENARWADAAT